MIIRHKILEHWAGYTKFDRKVFTKRGLSDGAKVLYGYLAGMRSGANYTDKYVLTALSISQAVLTRRKKELKDANLILMDRLDLRTYALYVGRSGMPAAKVKDEWLAEEDIEEDK